MSITNQNRKNIYTSDGSQTEWPYTFPIVAASDIHVYLDGVEVTSNFTVDTDNEQVVYPSIASELDPVAVGHTITIMREVPLTQNGQMSSGTIRGAALESAYDKLTMMAQDMAEALSRCAKFPIDESPTEAETDGFLLEVEAAADAAKASQVLAAADAGSASVSAIAASASAVSAANSAQSASDVVANVLSSRFIEGPMDSRPETLPGLGYFYATDIGQEFRFSIANGWEAR